MVDGERRKKKMKGLREQRKEEANMERVEGNMLEKQKNNKKLEVR